MFTRGTPRDPQTWATFAAQPVPAWAIDYQTMGKALGYLGKDVAVGRVWDGTSRSAFVRSVGCTTGCFQVRRRHLPGQPSARSAAT